jgi:Fe-S-cluster containining protein
MSDLPRPECDHCGACCNKLIVEIGHIDVVREPKLLAVSEPLEGMPGGGEWDKQYLLAAGLPGKGCRMHQGGRCSIYPTRPNACVAFEPGTPECQNARYIAELPPLGLAAWPADRDELDVLIYGAD